MADIQEKTAEIQTPQAAHAAGQGEAVSGGLFWNKHRHHTQEKLERELREQDKKDPPDHGSTYHPAFWGAYKGHVRGLLRGLLIGALAGAIVGGGLALLAGPLALPALIAHFSVGGLIATMTGVGAIIGCELMGKIGNTAGNIASYFAQTEMRARYPSLPEIAPGSPAPGIGHHFEVPPDKDLKKAFNWRVALPGVLVGLGIGSLLAFGVGGGGAELLSGLGLEIFKDPTVLNTVAEVGKHGAQHAAQALSVPAAAATIGAGGLMGASFGINRGLFRTLFNYTDSVYDEGRLTGPTPDQVARDQARYKVQDPENPYPISGAQMYQEYQRLLNGYYKKSFTASWSGDRRGLLGGALAGSLSGLAAAGFAIGIGVIATGGIAAMAPFIPAIAMFCTALGARQGMHIFADAGRESAAVSVAHEIHAERIKALSHGPDISFDEAEKRACQRMTRHPDLNPPGTENKTWFNGRIGTLGLIVGAAVGIAMAPLAAPFITHVLGMHLAVMQALPLTAATFGLVGATMGMGDKLMDKLYGVADKIFMGTFFPGHSAADHISHDYPSLGPDSKLQAHGHAKQQQHDVQHEVQKEAPSLQPAIASHMPAPELHAEEIKTPKHVQQILQQGAHQPTQPSPSAVQQQNSRSAMKASSFAARRETEVQHAASQPEMAVVRS